MAPLDPLDGLEARPLETQVAVLATEVRHQRNALESVLTELRAAKRATYLLLASSFVTVLTFALTLYATRPG